MDYRLLTGTGFLVGLLDAANGSFLLRRRPCSFTLLFGLNTLTLRSEFVDHGSGSITPTRSFAVACITLLVLVVRWREATSADQSGSWGVLVIRSRSVPSYASGDVLAGPPSYLDIRLGECPTNETHPVHTAAGSV